MVIDSNQINVSNRKNSSHFVYISKKVFEKYDTIVLNALGKATSVAVGAAENLVRNGYAEYEKLETKTIEIEERVRDDEVKAEATPADDEVKAEAKPEDDSKRNKAKLFITLKKSAKFAENVQKFEDIKDENQKLKEKETASKAK